jgi:hypothetical protein
VTRPKSKWYAIPKTLRVTEHEYRANITGLNIVFGAVLGFVLARAEGLQPLDFATVLVVSSAAVIAILYLASSPYILFHGTLVAAAIAAVPVILADILAVKSIPQLMPTLIVWALMVLAVELLPRQADETDEREDPTP